MTQDLDQLRDDFTQEMGRSLAMPIAGAVAWTIAGVAALFLSQRDATYVLLFATGGIFPLALAIARPLNENILSRGNPLSRLMGMSVLMVNLLWALHLSLLIRDFEFFPLSLGIGLGIHWIVFSWIKNNSTGLVHAVLRTILVTALWWLIPDNPITAVAVGVVVAYLYSIVVMSRQPLGGARQI